MKKLSLLASALLLSAGTLNADITVKTGWQLLGATQDMNTTMFNDTCVDYIWKYDTTNITTPEWQIHVANGVEYSHGMTTIASFTKGEGYWAKGNADCVIPLAEPEPTTITHNNVTYGTVTSPFTSKVWLDKNLGASQVCTALDDTACYGDYYQWGREADGHEKSDSADTTTLATTLTAVDASFISGDYDWTTADTNGSLRAASLSKTDGTSICPVGYRVPTITEIEAETTGATTIVANNTDAFDNFLKLPSAGERYYTDGSVNNLGTNGNIWSSTPNAAVGRVGTVARYFHISSTVAGSYDYNTAQGFSVRCIKD